MASKNKGDDTNDTGLDTSTEVSNKDSGSAPNTAPEKTTDASKKEKIEQTHDQVNDDIMHHPDLVNPLDDTRIDIKSEFTKDSQRIKSDKHEFEYDAVVLGAGPAGEAAAMKLTKSEILNLNEAKNSNSLRWQTDSIKIL